MSCKLLKTLVLVSAITISICSNVQANVIKVSDVLSNVPLKQGIVYSMVDSEFKYTTTTDVIKKWGAALEVGYIGSDALLIGVSYDLGNLEKFAEVPILKYVDLDIGVYYGIERINQLRGDDDWGVSFKVLEVQF